MPLYIKPLITFNLSIFFLLLFQITQGYGSLSQAEREYEKSILLSPLIKKIHEEGLERRNEEFKQLDLLLNSVVKNDKVDKEKLHTSVLTALENDKEVFKRLKEEMTKNTYKVGVRGATYQFITHKMPIVVQDALTLAQQESTFYEILNGDLPLGYSITPPPFNYFPEETHIFSSGRRGNALKCLLFRVWGLQNEANSLAGLVKLFGPRWLDETPLVHITPLPEGCNVPEIESSFYFFKDSQTPKALLIINNGYTFGGHRDEARYSTGKKYGPQDCSSFVTKYVGCSQVFSTAHQAQYFQLVNGFQFKDLGDEVVKKWEDALPQLKNDVYIKSMQNVLQPLFLDNTPSRLSPGLVHAERKYERKKADFNFTGISGHTGFFIGTVGSASETKALTISASRDLEGTGKEFIYGVEERPFFSTPELLTMFFEVKSYH